MADANWMPEGALIDKEGEEEDGEAYIDPTLITLQDIDFDAIDVLDQVTISDQELLQEFSSRIFLDTRDCFQEAHDQQAPHLTPAAVISGQGLSLGGIHHDPMSLPVLTEAVDFRTMTMNQSPSLTRWEFLTPLSWLQSPQRVPVLSSSLLSPPLGTLPDILDPSSAMSKSTGPGDSPAHPQSPAPLIDTTGGSSSKVAHQGLPPTTNGDHSYTPPSDNDWLETAEILLELPPPSSPEEANDDNDCKQLPMNTGKAKVLKKIPKPYVCRWFDCRGGMRSFSKVSTFRRHLFTHFQLDNLKYDRSLHLAMIDKQWGKCACGYKSTGLDWLLHLFDNCPRYNQVG